MSSSLKTSINHQLWSMVLLVLSLILNWDLRNKLSFINHCRPHLYKVVELHHLPHSTAPKRGISNWPRTQWIYHRTSSTTTNSAKIDHTLVAKRRKSITCLRVISVSDKYNRSRNNYLLSVVLVIQISTQTKGLNSNFMFHYTN